MKNIHVTAANVARRYSISDTAVHYMYLQYLDIRPLPLPEIISEELVLEVLERIKTAYITEWSDSLPIRRPQTIVQELYEDIYS